MARKNRKPKSNKGSKKSHKSDNSKKDKSNFDVKLVEKITNKIKSSSMDELANLDDQKGLKHFVDEGGYSYNIAYQFSSFGKLINTNQLRKFYGELRSIELEENWENAELKLNLLRPQFAVAVSRKSDGKALMPIEFYRIIDNLIKKIKIVDDPVKSFKNLKIFVRFFEAIVAFHKFHEREFELEKSNKRNGNSKKGNSKNSNEENDNPNNFNPEQIDSIKKEISNLPSLCDIENLEKSFDGEGGFADIIAYQFSQNGKRVNPNQLRRFYGEIKRIERKANWEDAKFDFYMLKPRMAISVSRKSEDFLSVSKEEDGELVSKKVSSELLPFEFYDLIKTVMDKVKVDGDSEDSFNNLKLFAKFYESIVGYHKFHDMDKHEFNPVDCEDDLY